MSEKLKLVAGDMLAIAILTVIGFASHGETDLSFIPRMGTTFFPVFISWFVLAPWFGLFDEDVTVNAKLLWRVPLVMVLAAPLAAVLRAALLGSSALPLFTFILGSSLALGMLLWRIVFGFIAKRGLI